MRPDEHVWQIVESKKELENYLQTASQTHLKDWVAGLQATDNHHVIENTLLKLYREYILDVARWVPPEWRDAVRWVSSLTYLPAIQHLLSGNTAQQWMREDPELKNFTATNMDLRLDNFSTSRFAPLLDAWQSDQSLVTGWLIYWRSLWPDKKFKHQTPLNELIKLTTGHIETFRHLVPTMTGPQRQQLSTKLTVMFRKYAFQPVAVFIHLFLVALDIERLRGAIMRRSLFPHYKGKSA